MLRSSLVAATALLAACPSPQQPRVPDDRGLRIRIAQAEVRRGDGVTELAGLVSSGDPHARELALRGLGRIGGPAALAVLEPLAADPDAADALGTAAALDDSPPRALAVCQPCANDREAAAAVTALGRTGGTSEEAEIVALGRRVPEAAAFALARLGRRKLALTAEARAWLAQQPGYAATYALSREFQPEPGAPAALPPVGLPPVALPPVALALIERVADPDPETRAVAIAGLARRGAVAAARPQIEQQLRDRDWRVAVEAVRALAGEHGDDAGRDAVAAALARRYAELAAGNPAEAQVVIEGLRTLQPYGARPVVGAALAALAASPVNPAIAPLARGWIACLATAAIVRTQAPADFAQVERCSDVLPDHLRLPLLGDLVTAGAGDVAARRAAVRTLLEHADPRVRAAGLTALAGTKAVDAATAVATIAAALAAADPVIAGTAADAATALYERAGPDHAALDAAVVARASREPEPELSASLYQLIGKRVIAAGADACRAGLAGSPVRARAAAECLRALGEAVPAPAIAAAQPPPVDVAAVIGHDVRWHLATSRGEIVIQLRPDLAPWNVATIVALTGKHFYDGLEVHRVVPDFVVQGGDPTMSGVGGPGFTTPAEPSDGGFVRGGVGMADAGRDSAGSQWFVMHAAAPHLDARYTYIGAVISGQKSADALLIGDRVERATIELK